MKGRSLRALPISAALGSFAYFFTGLTPWPWIAATDGGVTDFVTVTYATTLAWVASPIAAVAIIFTISPLFRLLAAIVAAALGTIMLGFVVRALVDYRGILAGYSDGTGGLAYDAAFSLAALQPAAFVGLAISIWLLAVSTVMVVLGTRERTERRIGGAVAIELAAAPRDRD